MKIVTGPVIPKEKRLPDFPEEYEQVEFIAPENNLKEFSELIFPNTQDSIARIKELELLISQCSIRFINAIPQEISVVFPTSEISKLSEAEQENARKYVDNTVDINLISPRLIRFIPKEFVDALFEKGELLLSSYNRCKILENETRKDEMEGRATIKVNSGNLTATIESGISGNPLLLCCSFFQSDPEDVNIDAYDAGFIITNPEMFIIKILQGLSNKGIKVYRVLFGPCSYSDRVIKRYDTDLPNFVTGPDTLDYERLFQYQSKMCGMDIFFEKEKRFMSEKEWRFVFVKEEKTDTENNGIIITINHPEECCLRYLKKR